jgi:hypothetical protein
MIIEGRVDRPDHGRSQQAAAGTAVGGSSVALVDEATAGGADMVVAQVAQLARDRDELARRVAVLDAKLIEVTGFWMGEREAVRAAYRRGYFAGRASQRRGAAVVADPERHARGWIREVLAT